MRGCLLLVCCAVLFILLYALALYYICAFCSLCVRFVVMLCFVCVFDFGNVVLFGVRGCLSLCLCV